MATTPEDEAKSESRRILRRIEQENGPAGVGFLIGTERWVQKLADDADRADPAEYWGTVIGRILGFLIAIGLLVALVYVASGG
ncbi:MULTISPECIES: hypothetical protein [unclassified Mesorhizobium]|uniref:hypothetical protein n=1 Tax=unclassified Mesorhizobium TaxID=325217 RepID=UPI000FDA6EC2|nr:MULTISPECIES: hypothetical protein [unclassified Mesorhizobium]TGQ07585.1 hypothetical protein EN862_023520 [Mesorhizobium sp. M2E.F.Ca.ET.219.01.1.1]TGT74102.1 hypothetical protein EN809_014965 [Mesorhizobium sp. M2E.F.Ca.ET.166.01.1.1]TGW00616.1 hypothetical protein EN797_021145 [Mesorhizobium sp. M2E.F.Ca.ET.154.01.1.1]